MVYILHLYMMMKLSILNWVEGNESFSFVSEIRKISTFLCSIYTRDPSLFLIEFMFT